MEIWRNKITAGGPLRLPMRTRWAARVAQFSRSATLMKTAICFPTLVVASVLAGGSGLPKPLDSGIAVSGEVSAHSELRVPPIPPGSKIDAYRNLLVIRLSDGSREIVPLVSGSGSPKPLDSGLPASGEAWVPYELGIGSPIPQGSKVDVYTTFIVIHLSNGSREIVPLDQVSGLKLK